MESSPTIDDGLEIIDSVHEESAQNNIHTVSEKRTKSEISDKPKYSKTKDGKGVKSSSKKPNSSKSSSTNSSTKEHHQSGTSSSRKRTIEDARFSQFSQLFLDMQQNQLRAISDMLNNRGETEPFVAKKRKTNDQSLPDQATTSGGTGDSQTEEGEIDDFDALEESFQTSEETSSSPNFDTYLDELDSFFDKKEELGEALQEKIAKRVNSGLLTSAKDTKIKDTMAKYLTPENVPALKCPILNAELWDMLPTSIRDNDKESQKIQSVLVKSLVTTSKLLSITMTAKEEGSNIKLEEIFPLLCDQLRLGSCIYGDLTQQRREKIKPHMGTMKQLCKRTTRTSNDLLFGDNFAEDVKKVEDTTKILAKLGKATFPKNFKSPVISPPTPGHNNRGGGANQSTFRTPQYHQNRQSSRGGKGRFSTPQNSRGRGHHRHQSTRPHRK